MKQNLRKLQGEIASSTITVGDFNTPLIIMDRITRQKKTMTRNTFFSNAHEMFQNRPYVRIQIKSQ